MARPPSDLDDYLDWQERLESFDASDLTLEVFCLKEGVSRSAFYRWKDRLRDGIPEPIVAEKAAQDRAESAEGAAFVPISLKASPVEIELPNGGIVRLPWWKSFELRVHCAPGRHRSHDEFFRCADLLVHNTHQDALQLRSVDGPGTGGL